MIKLEENQILTEIKITYTHAKAQQRMRILYV